MHVRIRTAAGHSAGFDNAVLEAINGEIVIRRGDHVLFRAPREDIVYWSTEEEWTEAAEHRAKADFPNFVACPACDSPRVLSNPEPPRWVCAACRHEFEADGERSIICVVK